MRLTKIVLSLIILFFSSCSYNDEISNYYIMSYGICNFENYPKRAIINGSDSQIYISKLSAPYKDVLLLKKSFNKIENAKIHFYDRYISSNKNSVSDKLPTKQQFLNDINEISEIITDKDYFIFHYAGHGLGVYEKDAKFIDFLSTTKEDSLFDLSEYKEYLCFYLEAPISSNYSENNWENPTLKNDVLISDDEIYSVISKIKTRKKIVLLDCCNSGGFVSTTNYINSNNIYINENEVISPYIQSFNLYSYNLKTDYAPYIIAASGELGLSYESSAIQNGIMSYAFCEALTKADYNNNNVITISEIYRYIDWFCTVNKFKKGQNQLTVYNGQPLDLRVN